MPHLAGSYGSRGAILDIWIGVSEPRARVLRAKRLEVPQPIKLPFLIDTGADSSMVSEDTMRHLGIPDRGARMIVGSTTRIEPTSCPTYDVQFELRTYGDQPLTFPALEVIGRPFFNEMIYGLIGRDVLNRVQLQFGQGRFRIDY